MSNRIPLTIKNHRNAWLWKPIWKRMHHKNKMWSAVFCAEPGSGKSWAALSIADLLDRDSDDKPRFTIDRVAFTPLQFMALVKRDWPKGTVIILDDAGLALCSKDAMTKIVRQLGKVFQSCRYKNLGILLTLPSLSMLESHTRQLLKAYVEPTGIDFERKQTRVKYHVMQTNVKQGKTYFHRPERRERGVSAWGYPIIHHYVVDSVLVDVPRKGLTSVYERKRRHDLKQWYDEQYRLLSEMGKPKPSMSSEKERAYAKAVRLKKRGLTFKAIAKQVKRHPETVRMWFKGK